MTLSKSFNHSYWEIKHFFRPYDLIVVGSGIVGLNAAISFKQKNKKARVLVLEKGIFLEGASSKNAGFACFGSAGELISDLKNTDADTVWQTVEMRWKGLELLRQRLKDKNIDYKAYGGYELFDQETHLSETKDRLSHLNNQVKKTLGLKKCYTIDDRRVKWFGNINGVVKNAYEGQLDTGMMMSTLLSCAHKHEVEVLNGIAVNAIKELGHKVELQSQQGTFTALRIIIATNGFANQLLRLKDVKPARAQVLVTKPIANLRIKGAFHYQEGYYYFRNIDNRILFGGGRNLDFETETTTQQGLNPLIQRRLDKLLSTMILPGIEFEIEHRWTGIMGVGSEKKPIIKHVSQNVLAAVRMGGMGVAIGSLVGENAAKILF